MKVIIIAAHPDDIEPQMGGTILKHVESGDTVQIIQVTSPPINGDISIRKREAKTAASILGADIMFLNIESNKMTDLRTLTSTIDELLYNIKPHRVYSCWQNDSHPEHTIVSNVVIAATRKNDCDVIFFEPIIPGGLTSIGFDANMFVDITEYIDIKEKAIRMHKSQLDRFGEHWIEAVRGRSNAHGFRINKKHAEAFKIVKLVQ